MARIVPVRLEANDGRFAITKTMRERLVERVPMRAFS